MENSTTTYELNPEGKRSVRRGGVPGGSYGLAFLGALGYYLHHASSFGEGLLGILKAIVWPAMLVYNLMEHLKM